ncbi:MAG: hypothetical protein KDC70_04995 [Saprospiraceae bacterium]|nr:hypothetical protein [Saprospiraceae bacterium]
MALAPLLLFSTQSAGRAVRKTNEWKPYPPSVKTAQDTPFSQYADLDIYFVQGSLLFLECSDVLSRRRIWNKYFEKGRSEMWPDGQGNDML